MKKATATITKISITMKSHTSRNGTLIITATKALTIITNGIASNVINPKENNFLVFPTRQSTVNISHKNATEAIAITVPI